MNAYVAETTLAEAVEAVETVRRIRDWVEKQRTTPWTESGSFASRMTGEEGYDAALFEVEAMVGE